MNTKLTIKLDRNIIEKAKRYAKSKNISLSRIIESYLNAITRDENKDDDISPFVRSLSGIIKIPDNFDFNKNYTDHLFKKY